VYIEQSSTRECIRYPTQKTRNYLCTALHTQRERQYDASLLLVAQNTGSNFAPLFLILQFAITHSKFRSTTEHMATLVSSISTSLSFPYRQGDQIGRIFAHWAILFFGQFIENYRSCANSRTALSTVSIMYVLILTKTCFGLHFVRLFFKLIWSRCLPIGR
jgi:hypothetical protein